MSADDCGRKTKTLYSMYKVDTHTSVYDTIEDFQWGCVLLRRESGSKQ